MRLFFQLALVVIETDATLPVFDGAQQIRVPEGTQPGSQFRIRNLGVPLLNSRSRGDLYVHLDVQVPKKLTRDQRKLFEQLAAVLPIENTPHEKSVFDKVRDFFG